MNTLYYAPGTCAIGIHVLLEEIGEPYGLEQVDFRARAQYQPPYVTINPKSKVPALRRGDGSVLTEFPAIALYLALTHPDKRLMPTDIEGQVRAFEAIDYIVATLHMQGWQRIWRPGNFHPNESEHALIRARGQEIVDKGLQLLDAQLAGKDYFLGDFSIADAALYYFEFWLVERGAQSLPNHCAAHYALMSQRPSVQAMLRQEGLP